MKHNTFSDEQILEAYNNASQDVQKLVVDNRFGALVCSIGKKYGITPTQCVTLANELTYILLGLSSFEDLPQTIQESFTVPAEIARRLANELKTTFFSESEPKEDKHVEHIHSDNTTRREEAKTPKERRDIPPPPPPIHNRNTTSSATQAETPSPNKNSETKATPHPFEQKLREITKTNSPLTNQPASQQPDPYREPIE